MRTTLLAAVALLLVAFSSAHALPATGQIGCWDTDGMMVVCTGTGQDGDTQWGPAMTFTPFPNGTIRDNNTTLVWETKTNCSGATHCVGDVYTWHGALDYVKALNAAAFAGYTDWRVPNIKELMTLLNYENDDPAVSTAFNQCALGSCTASYLYWSSTSYKEFPDFAFFVNFENGDTYSFNKFLYFHVRAVRAGRP